MEHNQAYASRAIYMFVYNRDALLHSIAHLSEYKAKSLV